MVADTPVVLFAGRFRLEEVIGEGLSGRVMRATDLHAPATGPSDVVVKIAADGLHARAELTAEEEALTHFRSLRERGDLVGGAVPLLVDAGIDGGRRFLAMERVGTPYFNLGQVATDAPPIERDVIEVWLAVVAVLEAAHDAGFLHNDLGATKLAHLWWDPFSSGSPIGRIKVIDWGNSVWPGRVGNQSPRTVQTDLAQASAAVYAFATGVAPEPTTLGTTVNPGARVLSEPTRELFELILAPGGGGPSFDARALRAAIVALPAFHDARRSAVEGQTRIATRHSELVTAVTEWLEQVSTAVDRAALGRTPVPERTWTELREQYPVREGAVTNIEWVAVRDEVVALQAPLLSIAGFDAPDQALGTAYADERLRLIGTAAGAIADVSGIDASVAARRRDWLRRYPTARDHDARELLGWLLVPENRAFELVNRASTSAEGIEQDLILRASGSKIGRLEAGRRWAARTFIGADLASLERPLLEIVDASVGSRVALIGERVARLRKWYDGLNERVDHAAESAAGPHRAKALEFIRDTNLVIRAATDALAALDVPSQAGAFTTDRARAWVAIDPLAAPVIHQVIDALRIAPTRMRLREEASRPTTAGGFELGPSSSTPKPSGGVGLSPALAATRSPSLGQSPSLQESTPARRQVPVPILNPVQLLELLAQKQKSLEEIKRTIRKDLRSITSGGIAITEFVRSIPWSQFQWDGRPDEKIIKIQNFTSRETLIIAKTIVLNFKEEIDHKNKWAQTPSVSRTDISNYVIDSDYRKIEGVIAEMLSSISLVITGAQWRPQIAVVNDQWKRTRESLQRLESFSATGTY